MIQTMLGTGGGKLSCGLEQWYVRPQRVSFFWPLWTEIVHRFWPFLVSKGMGFTLALNWACQCFFLKKKLSYLVGVLKHCL